jgi:hypothetical protein
MVGMGSPHRTSDLRTEQQAWVACSAITASRSAHDPHPGAADGEPLTQP